MRKGIRNSILLIVSVAFCVKGDISFWKGKTDNRCPNGRVHQIKPADEKLFLDFFKIACYVLVCDNKSVELIFS
jgi:hypothetical protein